MKLIEYSIGIIVCELRLLTLCGFKVVVGLGIAEIQVDGVVEMLLMCGLRIVLGTTPHREQQFPADR